MVDPTDWTTSELFEYAQDNELINEEDTFDEWIHSRTELLDLVEEHLGV